jgi:glycosyltransferase involved in cell wall biosynthesis
MKIAQVAPLYERVPPKLYGGTERVVSYLTEELVRQGQDVTLFASGDSQTQARLRPACDQALRLHKTKVRDPLAYHIRLIEMVAREARKFDLVHFHIDYLHFSVTRRQRIPAVTTLHGRLDTPELAGLYREFRDMPLVSISDSQRTPLPWANWVATIHHGLPAGLLKLSEGPGKYLAFLGRISPEKRLDRAIAIAKQVGIPIRVAAKIDPTDEEYFEERIRKMMDSRLVDFIGEINEDEKQDFLGNAIALLFPIDWPEPFGMVLIEAMACGTPVIAYKRGSVPEIIDHGTTGFIVQNLEQAAEAVRRTSTLDRSEIRRVFEQRFTVERMCSDYLKVYENIMRDASGKQSRGSKEGTSGYALDATERLTHVKGYSST